MKNYVQKGETLYATAPVGGVVSGQALVIGKLFGVAEVTASAGATFAFARKGVFNVPKANAQAWAFGDSLYWDPANNVVTNVNSGGLLPVGFAAAAAANPTALGSMLIQQASA